jgi:hypothetical protein
MDAGIGPPPPGGSEPPLGHARGATRLTSNPAFFFPFDLLVWEKSLPPNVILY